MMPDISRTLFQISIWAIPAIIAITLHEAAHGFVAHRLGDDTAWRLGRVSFNPLRHIDPIGTILLPITLLLLSPNFMFGYAKPVPVNFRNLRNPRRDMILVAAAGPGINILLALVSALLFNLHPFLPAVAENWAMLNLQISMFFNILLAVFNMIPLPPLDGGRVIVGLLPRPLALRYARIEPYGMLILIGAIFLLPMLGNQLGRNLNVLGWIVSWPTSQILRLIAPLAGLS